MIEHSLQALTGQSGTILQAPPRRKREELRAADAL
jgi:hypothetical protein